jgi:hypothetical protein
LANSQQDDGKPDGCWSSVAVHNVGHSAYTNPNAYSYTNPNSGANAASVIGCGSCSLCGASFS